MKVGAFSDAPLPVPRPYRVALGYSSNARLQVRSDSSSAMGNSPLTTHCGATWLCGASCRLDQCDRAG